MYNRGPEPATIHVLPHLWFRNFWKHNSRFTRPEIISVSANCLQTISSRNGSFFLITRVVSNCFAKMKRTTSGCITGKNEFPFVKDGINNYVVNKENTVNPQKQGTKAAIWLKEKIKPGASEVFKIRLCKQQMEDPWTDFDEIFLRRLSETDQYYDQLAPKKLSPEHKALLRSSVSGLMWTKQFYYLDVFKWLFGEPRR